MATSADDVPPRPRERAPGEETRDSGKLLALTRISRLINTSLDPQELCETVVGLLRETFAYDRASIYTTEEAALFEGPDKPALPDVELAPSTLPWFSGPRAYFAPEPEAGERADADDPTRWRLVRRTTSGDNAAPANISLLRGVIGRTARTGQPAFLPNISSDPDYIALLPGGLSEIALPLAQGNEVLGILNVESARRRLDEQDYDLLLAVADLLSVALYNARLYQQTQRERDAAQRYADQLLTLHRIGHTLLTTPRLSDMLTHITSAALDMSGGVYAALHLPNANRKELEVVAPRSPHSLDKLDLNVFRSQAGKGLVGICFERGETQYAEHAENDPRITNIIATGFLGIRSLLALPLIAEEQAIGVLSVGHGAPAAFSSELQQVLAMLADQAAIAIRRANLHEELRDTLERATELDQLKDLFLLMASHELRTPLTAVMGYLELLAEYPSSTDENAQHFLSRARMATEEIVLLLNNILDGTRSELDRSKLSFQQVPLDPLIEDVLTIVSARARQTLSYEAKSGLCAWADEVKVRQILLNLLTNAIKYSPGKTTITVSTSSDDENGMVTVSVHDDGPGIPLEDQPRLFQKFVRLTDGINSTVRGTGLGLYICRLLVQGMRGQIGLKSAPGEGSTFWFKLPAQPQPESTGVDPF